MLGRIRSGAKWSGMGKLKADDMRSSLHVFICEAKVSHSWGTYFVVGFFFCTSHFCLHMEGISMTEHTPLPLNENNRCMLNSKWRYQKTKNQKPSPDQCKKNKESAKMNTQKNRRKAIMVLTSSLGIVCSKRILFFVCPCALPHYHLAK